MNQTPKDEEREQLKHVISTRLMAYGLSTVSELAQNNCIDALADFILADRAAQKEALEEGIVAYFKHYGKDYNWSGDRDYQIAVVAVRDTMQRIQAAPQTTVMEKDI